jgi:hypothetical protein
MWNLESTDPPDLSFGRAASIRTWWAGCKREQCKFGQDGPAEMMYRDPKFGASRASIKRIFWRHAGTPEIENESNGAGSRRLSSARLTWNSFGASSF